MKIIFFDKRFVEIETTEFFKAKPLNYRFIYLVAKNLVGQVSCRAVVISNASSGFNISEQAERFGWKVSGSGFIPSYPTLSNNISEIEWEETGRLCDQPEEEKEEILEKIKNFLLSEE